MAYAERLPVTGVEALMPRLYGFGRVPLSSPAGVDPRLPGPGRRSRAAPAGGLERHWSGSSQADWLSWDRRRTSGSPPHLPYKLYISPHVDALTELLPAAVAVLTAAGASHFKVGSDAAALLRPDKFVVYLRDAGELSAVAGELARALAGARPHGVPFSAELAGDGLLSWGGDPPRDAGPAGAHPESWRLSVCRRLAENLIAAKASGLSALSPSRYALAL